MPTILGLPFHITIDRAGRLAQRMVLLVRIRDACFLIYIFSYFFFLVHMFYVLGIIMHYVLVDVI
jgi:hypothetical protein